MKTADPNPEYRIPDPGQKGSPVVPGGGGSSPVPGFGSRNSARGMTLVELLVAFVILLMLVAALVTLTTRSLETWTAGEARKDMYDRAQVVLDLISADLRNLYAETELFFSLQGQAQVPPALQCDLDKNNRPRIRFVRSGNPAVMRAPAGNGPQGIAPSWYGPTWEIAYVLDPNPDLHLLHRGIRGFDRKKNETLLNPVEYSSTTDVLWGSCFTQVESGILYVDFRFWTQFTTTWDDSVAIHKNDRSRSRSPSGPEKRWDSTRRDSNFYFQRKAVDLKNPDFVYPEIIQVTVTVESGSPDLHGVKVAEQVDERSTYIHLSHTRGMPDGPAMVKIGGEWIEYREKTTNDLSGLRRGQRNTKSGSHPIGTAVHFGETFTTEVKLPVYREAQEP